MGGTGGKESLNDLGLVPQSVLMVKWEDEAMNGESSSFSLVRVRIREKEEAK
jgi:tether containing UBX domain for GLUT4